MFRFMLLIVTYTYNICQGILIQRGEKMNRKIIITKKNLKGEDGYKVFSIRVPEELVLKLDDLSRLTGRSRNDLINTLLSQAIDNCEVTEEQ